MRQVDDCPFCKAPPKDEYLAQGEYWHLRWDAYPVSEGHMLITPKRHIQRTDDLLIPEWRELQHMLECALLAIKGRHGNFDGYNFGTNNGEAAGQTVFHLHFHVIPRRNGDCENPRGGIRKVKKPLVEY